MTETDIGRHRTAAATSLQMLLTEIVDYAGMFPPASLELEEAVERYVGHRTSDEAWMLGTFVCPAQRLHELLPLSNRFDESPLNLSVLATGAETSAEFLDALEGDLEAIFDLRERRSAPMMVRQLEARLPEDLLDTDVITVRKFIDQVDAALERAEIRDAPLFFEVPLNGKRHQVLPVLYGALSAFNRTRADTMPNAAGTKVRLGGGDVPSAESLAFMITTGRDAGVRFKATAGLHHAFYQYDRSADTGGHGFINLFVAAVLATANELEVDAVAQILVDEEPEHFQFTSDGLEWMTYRATNPMIERVRRERAFTFGSCNFDEPLEDLRRLGLL